MVQVGARRRHAPRGFSERDRRRAACVSRLDLAAVAWWAGLVRAAAQPGAAALVLDGRDGPVAAARLSECRQPAHGPWSRTSRRTDDADGARRHTRPYYSPATGRSAAHRIGGGVAG